MVRRLVLVVAITSAACIKLAEFHPLDTGGDGPMADAAPPGECGNGGSGAATATMSGSSICAAGPGYALRFPARGFHYPDQLRIGATDVLGTSSACNEEDKIGMSAYPLPPFSPDSAGSGETASATILLGGPVIAKVAVNWSWHAATSCVPTGMFSGTSMFTLFPDGKLVRFDQLTTPTTSSHTSCDCSSGAAGFFVTSYLSLAQATLTNQSGGAITPNTGGGVPATQLMCATGTGWGIGIAQLAAGRARQETGGAVALTFDFDANAADTLTAGTHSTVTAYQIGDASSCMSQLALIDQYTMPTGPQLNLSGVLNTTIGTELDGIFGGYNGTAAGIPTGGPGTLTLTAASAAIPAGWAFWIRESTVQSVTANPPRTGDWYKIQNGTTDGIIWFRDGLSGSDSITVTAQ